MDFKFNFAVEKPGSSTTEKAASQSMILVNTEKTCKKSSAKVVDLMEVVMNSWERKNCSKLYEVEEIILKDDKSMSLDVVTPCENSFKGTNSDGEYDANKNDLIPDVYEGGFKIWECTLDLVNHIENEKLSLKDKRILDLGCGVGVLGTYALVFSNAAHVIFQDYNENVIVDATIPTMLQNLQEIYLRSSGDESCRAHKKRKLDSSTNSVESHDEQKTVLNNKSFVDTIDNKQFLNFAVTKVTFLTGDWSDLVNLNCKLQKCDIILSTETIYSESCYQKLHDFLHEFLSPDGVIYMGAKSHYFGVGGNTVTWLNFVNSKNIFEIKIVQTFDDNLKRHIIRMKFKK